MESLMGNDYGPPIIPVYLNQRIVFDLIAMLKGGISTVTTVSRQSSSTDSTEGTVAAGFGLGEAIGSLMKVNLSGERNTNSGSQTKDEEREDRIHTPASLVFQLRNMLAEKGLLQKGEFYEGPLVGEFIEIEGRLQRNPVIDGFSAFIDVLDIVEAAKPLATPNKKSPPKGSRNKDAGIQARLENFIQKLQSSDSIDLLARSSKYSFTTVITAERAYLNRADMSDLIDGQFKVLGKVIKSLPDRDDSISFLRNTGFERFTPEKLSEAFASFSNVEISGVSVPEFEYVIPGPAIQVIPIAIYA
jgi:hypothetical protein